LFTFLLTTHEVSWLRRTEVPLFISVARFRRQKTWPRAIGPWALDSGAFTEISKHGSWTVSPEDYAAEVKRIQLAVGNMQWASIQDWMCEPFIIEKTGLSIAEHQRLTVENYLRLMEIDSSIPWAPVLQGYDLADYMICAKMYKEAGVDLHSLPIVGVGTMCRRQGTVEGATILRYLVSTGLRLHAFGLKIQGLARVRGLVSSDSLAWSAHARHREPLPGHTHLSCANCLDYALQWMGKLSDIEPRQAELF
jgi:hypothetical protein